ncbi:MAG: RHS repeat protein, partial [Gammaproteobacteria bacterium]|nr:RHS repeat protein [Gammaproteobacteria bacterium]
NSIYITRNAVGHIQSIGTQARTINMTYGANNFINEMQDSIGRTVTLAYNSDDRIETFTDSMEGETRFTYVGDDEFAAEALCPQPTFQERIKTIHYPGRATPTTNHYGPSRRVLRQTGPDGEHRFIYKVTGACIVNINKPNEKCSGTACPTEDSWEHYQAGWRIYGGQVIAATVTDPKLRSRHVQFNARGNILETEDEQGGRFIRKFDKDNNLIQLTDPLGRITRFAYDDKGNTIRTIDADNRITEYSYDAKWNKVTHVVRYRPDNTVLTLAQLRYDTASGRLLESTDANGNVQIYNYTAKGQLKRITNAQGKTTELAYNAQGDLISLKNPLGHTVHFKSDGVGRTIQITDALGFASDVTLNTRNQHIEVKDPAGGLIKLEYDARGNLAKVWNQNNQLIQTNTYDEKDRALTSTDGANKTQHFTYDPAGNVGTYTDRQGRTLQYSYDNKNQRVETRYSDGSTKTRSYDTVDRLSAITDNSGTISYSYDNLNRVIQETTSQGNISYRYDDLGRRIEMQTPWQTISYAYDDKGNLISIRYGADEVTIAYDTLNRRRQLTYPNGIVANYTYDDASRLTQLSYKKGSTVVEQLNYDYDAAGNIIKRDRHAASTKQASPQHADYDLKTNRLIALKDNDNNIIERFQYDDMGNMIQRTNSCGTTQLTWNIKNQLTDIQGFKPNCEALTASFSYDAIGRRTESTINSHSTRYVHDGLDVIAELGTTNAHYLRTNNIDEAIARYSDSGDRYLLTDMLGSTQALTNITGQTTTTYRYSAYGETATEGESSENPTQYTGRENDDTGLYYYRARYYAPGINRFISSDPIGLRGGMNVYGYANNNPIRHKDPLGLEVTMNCRPLGGGLGWTGAKHCSVIIWHYEMDKCGDIKEVIDSQYSVSYGDTTPLPQGSSDSTYVDDTTAFESGDGNYRIDVPSNMSSQEFDTAVKQQGDAYNADSYRPIMGPNSNTAADNIIEGAGGIVPSIPGAVAQDYGE